MVNQELSWIGLDLGDYKIDLRLGGGIFSTVYRGVHIKSAQAKAFKVAKPQDLVRNPPREDCLSTRAIALTTGSTMVVLPDAAKLLARQHAMLSTTSHADWIKVDSLVEQPALTYYEMDFVDGETLRQAMTRKPISLEKTIEIARCLAAGSILPGSAGGSPASNSLAHAPRAYHGDIKPENILITKSGITMIDPGHFGRLDLANGSDLPNCAVTTVAYYPTLEPDDLLAFGLMLFEMVLGFLPTAKAGDSQESDLSRIGPNLLEMVRLQEMVGKYFSSGILDVPLPSSVHPEISADVEKLLLKCIRLNVDPSGKLELDSGFGSFGAIADALAALPLPGTGEFLLKHMPG